MKDYYKWMLILFLSISCIRNANRADIIGLWQSKVDYPSMKGTESISCLENSNVLIIDSLIYELSDEDVDISIKCTVTASGYWSLSRDSLKVNLKKYVVRINPNSLRISSNSSHISIDSTRSNYSLFKHELCKQIDTEITEFFQSNRHNDICIGEIQDITESELILNSYGKQLSFIKIR